MQTIARKYVVDEQQRKVAVQLDIETFGKIEELLENYALIQLMKENDGDESLAVHEAQLFYGALPKAK